MNVMRTFAFLLVSFCCVAQVSAYTDSWENFDSSSLDGYVDDTLGGATQAEQEEGQNVDEVEYEGIMDSFDIISATMGATLSCLDWQPVGGCIWMTCVLFACEFDFSLKVQNYVPDITIQSYNRANGEPWTESQDINKLVQAEPDSSWVAQIISLIEDFAIDQVGIHGGVSTEGNKHQHANLHFKLVDAYGNPGITAFNEIVDSFGYVCPGSTTMFVPYFISSLDSVAWRWDVPEMFYPMSLIPVITTWDLGTSTNNWGPIYPRHGFMTAQDPLKSAVLSAFRAAHVFTREGEPHLYLSIAGDRRDGWWPPGPLDQNDPETGQWQMLSPVEEDSCRSFPYEANPGAEYRSWDASYIWNFWRSYKCCDEAGAVLIADFG